MDARRRKLPGRQCVTEDFLLFGGLRALGLGVQGGGEAVVLVQRVFHISGEFVRMDSGSSSFTRSK